MEEPLTITAASGWALPPDWFHDQVRQYFPSAIIRVLYPENPADPDEARQLLQSVPAKLYIGYSLGSLWLLKHRQYLPESCQKVLLAPILGFTREMNKAGNTSKTQLKYLIRHLKNESNDNTLILDFYADCRIAIPEPYLHNIPDRPSLVRGLEFLESNSESAESARGFKSFVGEMDHLLAAADLKKLIPDLIIVKDACHAPACLLKQLAANLNL